MDDFRQAVMQEGCSKLCRSTYQDLSDIYIWVCRSSLKCLMLLSPPTDCSPPQIRNLFLDSMAKLYKTRISSINSIWKIWVTSASASPSSVRLTGDTTMYFAVFVDAQTDSDRRPFETKSRISSCRFTDSCVDSLAFSRSKSLLCRLSDFASTLALALILTL